MTAVPSPVLAPEIVHAAEQPVVVDIDQEIAYVAKKHHLNADHLWHVVQCESGFNPEAIGDHGTSIGIAQLHYPDAYWGISTSSAENPEVALEIMGQAWEDGKAGLWSCYKQLYGKSL